MFLCYNPPVVNPELGIRAPYLGEAAKLAGRLLREKIATIVFAQSRLTHRGPARDDQANDRGQDGRRRHRARVSRRLSPAAAARGRAGAARGRRAGRGRHQRPRARHRHRASGRAVLAGYPRHHRLPVAAVGPGRPPQRPVGGDPRGDQRPDGPVPRRSPRLSLRRVPRARADQSGEPVHPRQSPQVRRLRAAVRAGRGLRRPTSPSTSPRWRTRACSTAPAALSLDLGDLPRRPHLAAHRHLRQLPGHRHHRAGREADQAPPDHRRGGLEERLRHDLPEGDLHGGG